MKIKNWKGLLFFSMLGALIVLCLFQGIGEETRRLSYPEFWSLAESGEIASVTLGDGEEWQVGLADGQRALTPNPRAADGKERLLSLGITVHEQDGPQAGMALGALALGAVVVMLSLRSRGAVGLQKYAAVQANESIPDVTFQDVAADEETMKSMRDLVTFLKEPQLFSALGARAPKGVMLYGPPGTGKTLLARALAGEAKAPFFAMGGADFVQVYVGVGASRVRELFRKARKAGGGVIFIDEIDAIGKKRDSGNDEREQTLNALLTEMSGFSGADGIIVLAATNRMDTLDAALLREGRFDRRIEVGLPDYAARLKILQVHARKKPLSGDVRLEDVAHQTTLFSGAQLETLLNEAAIRAARRGGRQIEKEDMEQAYRCVTVGEDRPQHLTNEEKRVTAYHEAGHALITHFLLPDARITRVTIIPSSRGAAGYSMSVQPDKLLHTRRELMGMIAAALGGRTAEEMILGRENVTTGAANDIEKAREIAGLMAEKWAMGETGEGEQDKKAILCAAREEARACLTAHRKELDALAGALISRESLDEKEILGILTEKERN